MSGEPTPARIACLEAVAEWAHKTREAQRSYFRYRTQRDLHWARNCETILDQKLKQLDGIDQPIQPKLF